VEITPQKKIEPQIQQNDEPSKIQDPLQVMLAEFSLL